MKTASVILLSFLSIFLLSFLSNAETFKPESYTVVEIPKLKAIPEEYKNKKVCYESVYVGYETTFPPYVEKSGFKAGKDFCLLVRPMNLPVMAGKTKEINELVPTLKRGAKVKIYGKIKKFMNEPEATTLPHYYLDLEKIEVVVEDVKVEKKNKADEQPAEDDKSPWQKGGKLNIGPPRDPQKQ